MGAKYKASVVIPTYKRPDLLRNLLGTLARQETAHPFEVIVVNDDPDEDLSALEGEFGGLPLKVVNLGENRGPAFARNAGVRSSSGEILIFLDDDTTVTKDFVAAHIEAHTTSSTAVVGNVLCMPEHRSALLARYIERLGAKKRKRGEKLPPSCFRTGNASVSRDMFTRAGMFDETIRTYGEDVDLAMKLSYCGADFVFGERAVAYNHSLPTIEELMTKIREWGQYTLPLYAELHPAFARRMWLHLAEPVRLGRENPVVSLKKIALRILLTKPFYAIALAACRWNWLGRLGFPVVDYVRLYNYFKTYRQARWPACSGDSSRDSSLVG
jgi:GT2 family glycosyltransferase